MAPGILLLTTEPETERQVSAAISSESGLAMGPTCRSMQELVTRLRSRPTKAAVVDLDPAPEKTLALLDPVIAKFGETRFILVTRSPAQQLLLEAMHVGARHVVGKESLYSELPGVLRRVAVNGSAKLLANGFVVSVMSASGGNGATLLAANLAYELRALTAGATLLIDLDLYSGAVASYLNVQSQYDLGTVLSDGERIDGEFIKSSAAHFDPKLYVLLSPAASAGRVASGVRFEHLPRLLWAAKESFDYAVIDAPRLPVDLAVQVASAGSLVIVPFQLTVVSIRAARMLIRSLAEHGIPPDQVLPVANRFRRRRAAIGLDEAARVLERDRVAYLSNDFKAAVGSNNLGQPLERCARRSRLRKDIVRLAEHLHQAHSANRSVGPIF